MEPHNQKSMKMYSVLPTYQNCDMWCRRFSLCVVTHGTLTILNLKHTQTLWNRRLLKGWHAGPNSILTSHHSHIIPSLSTTKLRLKTNFSNFQGLLQITKYWTGLIMLRFWNQTWKLFQLSWTCSRYHFLPWNENNVFESVKFEKGPKSW